MKNAVKDLQNIQNNNPYLSLLANNLSSLYLIEKNYLKAFKYSPANFVLITIWPGTALAFNFREI